MVKDPVAEDDLEGIVAIGNGERTALLQLVMVETAQLEPGADALDGFRRQIEPRPPGAAPDQLLGIGALPQADLQQALVALNRWPSRHFRICLSRR